MLQLIQNYRTGKLELADVPVPNVSVNTLLVKNYASLISIGTERSIIELGRKSLLGKARARPDLVKRFLDKAKKEGFLKTFQEAMGRLDNPVPLGYSSAGVVVEVGRNIHKFVPGDRVACIGAGYASHAEYVTVPENLCCRIPENVNFEEASFGMLGIIAMHGIRCGKLTFGERVAVIGLGLLGLLTVQILKAYGCMVMGFDIEESKVEMARKLGLDAVSSDAEAFKNLVDKYTNGFGADAVIITAATKSDAPVHLAVDIARFRGRIVVVGVADIHPDRNELWHKELELIVSKAAGPGSLDPIYENKGIDYPLGYVRWTENRNLEEFLRLVSEKKVNLEQLITHRFPIEEAVQVYENMMNNRGGPYVGVVLKYSAEREITQKKFKKIKETVKSSSVTMGVIGAGLFGKALLIPALSKLSDVRFHTLSTSSGINAQHVAKKYGFENVTTDYEEILNNKEINSVVILTPHRLHAKMVIECLKAGKHVFVEKPLCINEEELKEITDVYSSVMDDGKSIPFLMVGYNRRFSPHVEKLKSFVSNRKDPLMINYRVNAGFVPSEHWVHSEEEGGGRIIGEICHFIDLMIYLTNSLPIQAYADRVSGNNKTIVNEDNVSIVIKFRDGSVGNIFYSSSGDKSFSRERIEVYSEGKTLIIEDFKNSYFWLGGRTKKFKTLNQEIGYKEELSHFISVIKGSEKPKITYDEIYYSTLTTFKINESISKGTVIQI
ncbi:MULTISPECIES: bi-domain-containing oxidoreductase [Thermodesulfovibrio]|uniref:Oxidoreductase n=1 Tax=Thermodesulfovibrio yellowstonii TaxID=28262 RepID=A0A9W6LKY9_9BACT|nr:bi-domain-containing oxidoreductase [Thermodesulfovibrio islandicus]GLI54139.1 oxidoreductase [Thermodesulfovibrio islandicus]